MRSTPPCPQRPREIHRRLDPRSASPGDLQGAAIIWMRAIPWAAGRVLRRPAASHLHAGRLALHWQPPTHPMPALAFHRRSDDGATPLPHFPLPLIPIPSSNATGSASVRRPTTSTSRWQFWSPAPSRRCRPAQAPTDPAASPSPAPQSPPAQWSSTTTMAVDMRGDPELCG
ncbi:uncharacterized protein LOC119362475 [Triticum dicoccoides]|uniref:uncharacterized protein LOC119362475 n=1 Tax=Triticum dicoccoides TaxID=85692 RepID=UPI00188F2CAE|nr:uncharacterized protein LOC119362475 [Triticum dicoccoides]